MASIFQHDPSSTESAREKHTLNMALLRRLREAGGKAVPLEALGGDRAEVERDLADLEAFGFAIAQGPGACAAYLGPAERLCPDQIEWELGTERIGRRIAVWSRLASTNDLAARAARSRSNEGLVVLAEEQTAGRGRRGRTWQAPPRSGLLMSALIFPTEALAGLGWLTALGAVAVAELVEQTTGRSASIKWPNDVRVGGRKVAGILVERGLGTVIGIGLNVNAEAPDLPPEVRQTATTLQALTATRHDRSELARALIRNLDHHYRLGLELGPGSLSVAWSSRLEPLGRVIRLTTTEGPIAGRLIEADLSRGLTIALEDGRSQQIAMARITAFDDGEAG